MLEVSMHKAENVLVGGARASAEVGRRLIYPAFLIMLPSLLPLRRLERDLFRIAERLLALPDCETREDKDGLDLVDFESSEVFLYSWA